MKIGIVAKLKQGDILEALEKRGWNQTQGAHFLGIDASSFGGLINMTSVPKTFSPQLRDKLVELTGKFPEDLFPEFVRSKDFLDRPRVVSRIFEADVSLLSGTGSIPALLESSEDAFNRQEASRTVEKILETLPPEIKDVVKRHIMHDETLEEIARSTGVTRETVRRKVIIGLRELRSPARARMLRNCL